MYRIHTYVASVGKCTKKCVFKASSEGKEAARRFHDSGGNNENGRENRREKAIIRRLRLSDLGEGSFTGNSKGRLRE